MRRTTLTRLLASSLATCCLLLGGLGAAAEAPGLDPALLAGLTARSIGPAGMSGRVAAIDAVAADPSTIWIGAATGGVWKSVNGGSHWTPVFDREAVHSIGALAISPANPNVVWVGTGEGNLRNSASFGRGVYRTQDGGRTWQHLGLEQTKRIHRILPHPTDPDTVYVAALGRMWGENPERGVYRTRDGGKTWQRILHVDEKTGAADLVMDPGNPNKLFAAMWEYRRWPWFFKSGGPGSGLYLTVDGGETWRKATAKDGLPAGELGRIGVAIAKSDPRVVYALVEAKDSALLRSEDGGYTWKTVNKSVDVSERPFYYADLRVDPERPDRVYRLTGQTDVSNDGGKSFETMIGWGQLHPDHHALWIHPDDGRLMINGNDGGVGLSHDRGATWRFVTNLPLAQFYHVRYDLDRPYNLYGGLQDNGSWRGPSSLWEMGPIRNSHWVEVGFGDGFDTAPDPESSRRGYAMSQEGYLIRWDLDNGERFAIRPAAPGPDTALRFNWNAGFAQDPFEPGTIYYGSQFVHKSTDRGNTWTVISPDLTGNDPEKQKQRESGGLTPDVTGAENHTTIITIAPAEREQGVLWVGTDDGRVAVTRDGGTTWSQVADGARGVPPSRGVPEGTWVPHIMPSAHTPGTAFVVFDNHRRSDLATYAFRADDYGRRWTRIATQGVDGYALVLLQDPVEPNLLFLGTELGLYVSIDAGKSWLRFRHGLPTASVMDLAIHPREHDLIVATHGRAMYVIDDIRPLRGLATLDPAKTLTLFELAPAQQVQLKPNMLDTINSQSQFRGENRAYGALISFYLAAPHLPHPDPEVERTRPPTPPAEGEKPKPTKATIEVRDATGALVRRFETEVKQGLNRVVWNLRRDPYRSPVPPNPWRGGIQPPVVPDEYQVTVAFGDARESRPLTVLADPRIPTTPEQYRAKAESWARLGELQETLTDSLRRLQDARADATRLAELAQRDVDRRKERDPATEIPEEDPHRAFVKAVEGFKKQLLEAEKKLWQPPEVTKGIAAETDAQSAIGTAASFFDSTFQPVTATHLGYFEAAGKAVERAVTEVEALLEKELPPLREKSQALGLGLLP
ncbi:MAG TPA: hypothetical protein VF017_00065 [Thermoanaerobaculia bacterium]|nr:hypothetical protein [Thermoanaerobaculia bacterium]